MAKVSKSLLYSLLSTSNPLFSKGFYSTTTYTERGELDDRNHHREGVDTVEKARSMIDDYGKYYPDLVSVSQIAVSRREIARIKHYQDVDCSVKESEKMVYQMLSTKCSGMKKPAITGVQLVCSTASLSCKISITASLSSFVL